MSVKVGDKVRCSATETYNGISLNRNHMSSNVFNVMTVGSPYPADTAAIGFGGVVTAVVYISTLTLESSTAPAAPDAEYVEPKDMTDPANTDIESAATASVAEINNLLSDLFLQESNSSVYLKYNMRIFGSPHQHIKETDSRAYASPELQVGGSTKIVGRRFIENIFLQAPVVTIIPGNPKYLPGAKDKMAITNSLFSAAGNAIGPIQAIAQGAQDTAYLRYYDFQADYYTYMKYVNAMCQITASLLQLDDPDGINNIDGKSLTKYDWKNYRWNANSYQSLVSQAFTATGDLFGSFVDGVKASVNTLGGTVDSLMGYVTGTSSDSDLGVFTDNTDPETEDAANAIFSTNNFVQFYVDASSGASEASDNTTASSMMEGTFSGLSNTAREIAFVTGSAGYDDEFLKSLSNGLEGFSDAAASYMSSTGVPVVSDMSSLLERLGGAASNVIKGDNMVFPEIYQNSKFSRSYSMTINLQTPYGNRLGYYLNILVPLYHLLALVLPKQTTANSFGAPFIIKAYYPGVFACNLGIVSGIQIEKNSIDPLGWTTDGYPTDMRITLNITDLYADLSMSTLEFDTIALFLSNTSLIEYLATKCGINILATTLETKVRILTTAIVSAGMLVGDEIAHTVTKTLENAIQTFFQISFKG